jgi:glycosyltransferase involved in cell wall biosynthesis
LNLAAIGENAGGADLKPSPQDEITVVVPSRNEASTLEKVLRECWEDCHSQLDLKILVVDDASDDETPQILGRLSKEIPMKVVHNPTPLGFGGALKKGISQVDTPWVTFIDGDNQYDPKDILRLFTSRKGTNTIITGWRFRRADPAIRTFISIIFMIMNRIAFGLHMKDVTTSLKLGPTVSIQKIAPQVTFMNGSFWTEFMVRWRHAGLSFVEVPISHRPRRSYRSRVFEAGHVGRVIVHQFVGLVRLFHDIRGPNGARLARMATGDVEDTR